MEKYERLVDSIKKDETCLPDGPEGFGATKKQEIIKFLSIAGTCLDGTQPTPYDINVDIATTKRLFDVVEIYVQKNRDEVVNKKTESAEVAPKNEMSYKILREWFEEIDERLTVCTNVWQDRMYSQDDPNGQYQRWCNSKFVETFYPNEWYKFKYVDSV